MAANIHDRCARVQFNVVQRGAVCHANADGTSLVGEGSQTQWQGMAWRGMTWQGMRATARHGMADMAWHGMLGPCGMRQCCPMTCGTTAACH